MKAHLRILIAPVLLALACTTAAPPRASEPASTIARVPDPAEGRDVVALVQAIEPKSYTDDLPNGEVMVSDVLRFSVIEPAELAGVTVMSYYQGIAAIDGRRLEVGDALAFKLPSAAQRDGVLLWDLKDLRFDDAHPH